MNLAVSPREVFGPALERRAAAIVLAHNHPSGTAAPSPEDVSFTRQMTRAGALLGVPLVDHLVVARRGYFSFAEASMLDG
jgi:DNA repair protein RadC